MKSQPRTHSSAVLPIVALAAAVVVALIVWFAMHWKPAARNTNSGQGTNANTASVVGPTGAAEPTGTELSVNTTVEGSTLQLVKAFRASEFALAHAADGKEFIVVEFRQLPGNTTSLLDSTSAATLRAGSETYHPKSVSLPSLSDSQSSGSVVFEIPLGKSSLVLSLGSRTAIPLNLPSA